MTLLEPTTQHEKKQVGLGIMVIIFSMVLVIGLPRIMSSLTALIFSLGIGMCIIVMSYAVSTFFNMDPFPSVYTTVFGILIGSILARAYTVSSNEVSMLILTMMASIVAFLGVKWRYNQWFIPVSSSILAGMSLFMFGVVQ